MSLFPTSFVPYVITLFGYENFSIEDDESESTETFSLRTNQPLDPAILASPDLLSDMSDVRMSATLTAEQMEHLICEERAGARGLEGKEPLAIVFKDRLEKVGGIQRGGTNDSRQQAKTEKWGSLYETKTVEMKYPPVEEPVFQEICIEGKTSSSSVTEVRDMTGLVSHLSIDMDEYLEHRPVATCSSLEDLVQDRVEQVIVKRDGKRRPPDIKKPIRKKLRDRERSGCSSSEGELERMSSEESLDGDVLLKESALVPTTVMDPPVSPLVVETPIGSIKDRVKALQNKFEEEEVQKNTQELIPQAKSSITTKKNEADMPELPRLPMSPKSPRSQTERLEETMSVKELMNAFQTGQDPSKNKTGLFEHKAVASSCISTLISESGDSDQIQWTEQSPMQEPKSQTQTQRLTSFYQESDFNKPDKTDLEDRQVGLIRDDSEESQLISHSASFGKTVTFADKIQCDNRSVIPQTEVPEKETMSVKDLMKTFQTGHDPSKTKAGLFEHKVESSCISTVISESEDSEEIHMRKLTSFFQESDFNKSDKTDIEDRPVSSIRDDSDESQFISDSTSFGKTVIFADTVQRGDGSVSPQREASELSKETMSVKELLKTFQTGHDPSKTKAGLFEHKVESSCISTLISESEDSEEIHTRKLTRFYPEIDFNKSDKTDVEDRPVSSIRDDSDESQFISDSTSFGKTVIFAGTVQCGDGSVSPQREASESSKETMSVKELLKTFQTGHDPSKTKAGLFEHKVESSCISTVISESEDSEEIHMRKLTSFFQESDFNKSDKTDIEDLPVSSIRDDSDESQFISDSTSFGKTVTFAGTVQCGDGSVSPQREASESSKETVPVKELLKTFKTGHDPSKTKAGLYEHKTVASSCISTLISQSGDSEEIQTTEQGATQEPKSKTQTQNLTSFHQQSDAKKCYTADLEDQAISLSRDDSEESQFISDSASFGKTVTFADTVQCDDGSISSQREAPEKDTMSVKELMKAFQTVYDPSKTKAGLYEHKVESSCISTLISESGDSEEVHTTYQGATQEPKSQIQTQNVTSFHQQSDDKKCYTTDLEDRPVSLIRDDSEESQLISDSAYFGKMVAFADTVQCDDESIRPKREASEVSEKETTSVKELMKTFQAGQDPLKGKAGLGEHKAIASSCISTLISESVGPEEIQTNEHSPTQEPKSQFQVPHLTIFHPQSDVDICGTLDLEAQAVSLKRDNSEELQLISDIAYFGKAVEIDDTIQFDDRRVSPQREEPELSGKSRGRMQLEEPVISTGRSSSEDMQISPDRRPSEDFSADIKAELEESPEYQLFKGTAEDVSNHLEAHEEETLADSDTNPATISSPCIKSYFGKGASLTENQMKDDDLSPESPKHEGMAESSRLDIRTPRSSSGESENYEGLTVTHQMTNEMLTYSTRREETHIIHSQEERLHQASRDYTANDHGSKIFFTQTDTEVEIKEPQLQEVHIERNTSNQASTAVKDMSGMLSLMSGDLDQYLKARPVARQPPGEDIVQERFDQIILKKDNDKGILAFVIDENKVKCANEHMQTDVVGVTELSPSPVTETPFQEVCIERKTGHEPSTTERDMSGMLSLLSSDMDQYLEEKPVATQCHLEEEDLAHESYKQVILTRSNSEDKIDVEADEHMQTDVLGVNELSPSPVLETPLQEVCIERKTQQQQSATEKDMSGMLSLLSSDLDEYLDEKPVAIQCHPEEEDLVHESYKQVILTRSNSEDKIDVEADEHMQTDVVGVNELSPSPVSETPFQEVCIERKTGHEPSTTERDMSGMLSLLSSDLDKYLDEKPVAIRCHPEEEDLVHESYKEVILTSSNSEDKIDVEANEHMQTDVVGDNKLSPSHVLETPFQEVCIERKTQQQQSATERDMSGMLSLLSSDLDEYLEEKPVAIRCHPEEEDLVHESYKEVILTRSHSEDKIDAEANEHMQTDVVGVNELSPSPVLETPFQEVCIERKTQQQQSATEKDMSGMLSLLSSDLDEYLDEKPVAIQCHPEEEDLVHESYKEVILTRSHSEDKIDAEANEHMQTDVVGVNELSPSPVLETPFQEVCIERKTQQQQSATEKDMSGMLSLLSSDLDQYLEEKPVAILCHPEEEDLVHESYKQVILTSSNLEDKIDVEANEHMQTDVVGVNELSPSPVLETPFQEVCIERKTQQESAVERDMTGMLSLLSTDLNQYLKERPAAIQCHPEENLVHESYKEVRLPKETLTISPEHDDEMMSPEDTNLDFVDLNKKGAVESGWQTSFHGDERTKNFSSEEGEAKTSPCAASHFNDSTEWAVGITKSHVTMDDCNNDHKDANVVDAHSTLKTHKSSSDTSQRPANLENLNTLVFGDPAKEPCHQDSLEASPLMEDGSSKKSPDSIEPSPTGESPSPDSLEGSPTQSKYTEFKMAVKTAVYEDYASQLKACYSSDKNIYRDESEHDEQEDNYAIIQMQSEIKEDIHSYSADTVPDGMSSDTKICDSENLHILIRQDSLDADDSEDDAINKQFTPEEEMFKMAAKIKTFEEMEQDAKMKRDKSETGDFRDDEPDLRFGPVIQTLSQDASEENSEKYVTDKHHSDDDKEVESPLTDGSGSVMKPQAMACTKELEYVILGCEGENDVALNAQLEAEEQINLCLAEDRKTPDKTPGGERNPDPFQFQEGKLFEMTRGGAIDMTRRSFDEGEGYAFFHIGEHPVDEVVPETGSANDTIPTPKPRTLIKTSSDKPESEKSLSEADFGSSVEVQLGSPSDLEKLTNVQSEVGNLESLGLGYLDSTIADLQSDTSTVAHSAYSGQSHDSSDSSPDDDDEEEDEEDPCSVIEMSFSAAQAGIPAYHQDSCRPLEITMKDTQKSELDRGKRKAEKRSTLDRRTRSEADSDTSKASNKDNRSYSDSSQPTDKSNFSPSKLPVMTQQKPPTPTISSSSLQRKEIQLSKTTETSVRSSLDADDISSASQKSPDSVIFTYDIPASHSSDSEGNPLPEVQSSSGREDVFVYRPAWDDTVETQMQRIVDEPTPECTPVDWQDDADRKEETLAIVADLLGFSWTELARELEFSEDDIQYVRAENPNSLQEQSHALLQRWVEREGKHATEDCLIKRLTKINRMDIVHLIETQMNKSVQEQTSRTYAEIEKTLDHSEVSVALSSVQEDAESPRVVRRVESDRRPPPAVSEEDLSVASLLDIPSWAEPAGHTHSESMHGDLLEDLEIPHELNPNLWTSEDVITQEPTSYDNLDEQVSTASSRTNLSESSKQNKINLEESQVSPTETPSLAHDSSTLSTEKLELKLPGTFDLSKTLSEITLTNQSSSPQEEDEKLSIAKQSENSGLAKPSSVTPETLSQTAQESPDEQVIISLESNPTPPESGSPQLDQLLSDLEEMKLKFSPETLDLPLSEFSDESPEVDQIYNFDFEDLSPEDQCPKKESDNLRVSMSSATQLAEDTDHTNVAVIEPAHFQTSVQDEPEVVSVTPDLTKTSETSAKSSLGSCKDSPVSPFESLSTPESPQRSLLNSGFPVDIFQSSTYDENATETFPSVSFPQKSPSDILEEHLANLHESLSTPEFPQRSSLNSSFPVDIFQSSTYDENATETFSSVSFPQKSPSDILEEHLADLHESLSTPESPQSSSLNSSFPVDIFQSSPYDENATEKFSSVSFPQKSPSDILEEHLANLHESLSTPESPQRSPSNSSFPVDIFQSSTYDENATETFSSVSFPQKSQSDILEEHLADLHESLSTPESPKRSSLNSSFPVDIFQSSTYDENATETFSSVSFPQKSPSDILEEHLANLHEEDSTTDILQSQEELESATSSKDSVGVTEEISTQSIQDQLSTLWEATFGEANQTEYVSPQSISDLTPETVTSARHFSFEELMPFPCPENLETSSDEDRPRTIGQHSEESLTPVDCLASQPCLVKPKAETTSSPSDEEYDIPPGYEEITSTTTVVHSGADSPTFEYSDPEPFFDCIQAGSDFSETEPDEPEASTKSIGDHPQDHLSHSRVLEMGNRGVLLSSGSEDYEDAPFIHEPLYNVQEENEELLHDSEASDEEFSLCEASQPHPVCEIGAYDDTVKSLARADEMPDLPTESVTEERYKDENGHTVVKKVTRKVIRKCVSVDGVEREEVSSEGAPQGSISMAEGDGYSKVVKRTVLKSEGDHTEVTFAECEGLSASTQKTAEGCKVSRVERTTVVEGERTMTQQGDPSLASDLPSAQDDFKQALGYISGFSRTELPHVVERETFKEDGTVVRRAHMRKGRTHRRTVVKGAGQRKQVLLEQVDNPRKGSKPRDLQQHLHQLFHRSYEEEKKDNDEDEEEKEE
ncbi:uncharacterized protein ank2a isoform X2 [Sebastes fasciatus]|uniref:uncharacterized protein ank2a isoform X2 n=1 Tax=Sebastes fasciatus TaxID=394691 RepID=UPI003D9F09AA